jgi:hypothetical protein
LLSRLFQYIWGVNTKFKESEEFSM